MESRNQRPVDWNLLSRYVAGSCSDREAVVVETWAASDPENRRTLDELQQVWERVSRQQRSLPIDVDGLWDELSQEMRALDEESSIREQAPQAGDRPARKGAGRSRTSRRGLFPGAISVLVIALISIGVFLFEGQPRTEEATEKKVFTTQRGQRATVRLTDGTQVRLNVESRLTVLPSFGKKTREVRLEGEAFFEVAKDSTRPFTVHAREADARALGTAFDVHAYPDEGVTRVVVTEGRVAMRSGRSEEETQAPPEDVVLEKQEMGEVHRSGQRVVRRGVDPSAHLAWMDGNLVFEDAPFNEVTRKLERWYGIEISLREGTSPPEGSFNARFAEDQPLPEVLDLVSTVFGLTYQLKQKTVLFGSKK